MRKIYLTLGERIMLGRRRDGMSQGDLAEAEGVSQSMVSRWETGACLPPDHLRERYENLGRLSYGERAMILRRRYGMSLRSAARQYGVSHMTAIRLEADEGELEQGELYLRFIEEHVEHAA